ncbi:MAG: hypothetical protein HT580_10430 [Dechloromonas sp.]|nr:MAG: hypothetical protein HT580_10430 [Dechloromonas sp.]
MEEIAVVIIFDRVSEVVSDVLNDILIRQVVLRKYMLFPLALNRVIKCGDGVAKS